MRLGFPRDVKGKPLDNRELDRPRRVRRPDRGSSPSVFRPISRKKRRRARAEARRAAFARDFRAREALALFGPIALNGRKGRRSAPRRSQVGPSVAEIISMPLYEYRCERCSNEFEALVRGSSDVPRCPNCGAIDLARLFSVPAAARDSAAGGSSSSLPMSDPSSFGCGGGACRTGMCGME